MTPQDLSPIMLKAFNLLTSEEDKQEFLDNYGTERRSTIRVAVAAIMVRNLSHNIGSHVCKLLR
jgi:hypothetical protein